MRDQSATSFLQRNRYVHMMDVRQWKATEDGIAVVSSFQPDIALKRVILHIQGFGEQFHLAVALGSWHLVIDLLHQNDIRIVAGECFDNSLRAVATIQPSDAFMNVVSDDPELHSFCVVLIRPCACDGKTMKA